LNNTLSDEALYGYMHVTQLGRAATSLTFLWRAQSKRTHKFRGAHGNAYGINFFRYSLDVQNVKSWSTKTASQRDFVYFQIIKALLLRIFDKTNQRYKKQYF
jgi:hypothetical protein